MNQTVISDQVFLLLYALIFGIMCGAYYDIFRFIRALGCNGNISVLVQDIIFMITLAPCTYLFFAAFSHGSVRLSALIVQLMGLLLYRYTIGELTIRIFNLILKPIKAIIKFTSKPFLVMEAFLLKKTRLLRVKIEKKRKERKNKHTKKEKNCKKDLQNKNNVLYNNNTSNQNEVHKEKGNKIDKRKHKKRKTQQFFTKSKKPLKS